jgi:hypothetical protein
MISKTTEIMPPVVKENSEIDVVRCDERVHSVRGFSFEPPEVYVLVAVLCVVYPGATYLVVSKSSPNHLCFAHCSSLKLAISLPFDQVVNNH